jgi:hypothetical protein
LIVSKRKFLVKKLCEQYLKQGSNMRNSNAIQKFLCTAYLGCEHTSRVESSPIQSSQNHKDQAVTLWLTYNGRCGSAYTPAESS